jgi:molybdate transport system substrate-binding protein
MQHHWKRLAAALALTALAGVATAGELTVSSASSLGNAFKDIAAAYEAQHAGSKVLLNVGASGLLLQQLAKGAPVDVFASADEETMNAAAKQSLIVTAERHDFVRNVLVLVVPKGSTLALGTLDDLKRPGVQKIAIGNPASVPVGRYSRRALEAAKLWPVVSAKAITTQNVRQSLDYVARGEVDAGFVYATDAALMADKVQVAFAVPLDMPVSYPIAPTVGSAKPGEARRFIAYVLSPAGQAIFAKYGFRAP